MAIAASSGETSDQRDEAPPEASSQAHVTSLTRPPPSTQRFPANSEPVAKAAKSAHTAATERVQPHTTVSEIAISLYLATIPRTAHARAINEMDPSAATGRRARRRSANRALAASASDML